MEEEERSVLFTSWRPRFTAEHVSLRRPESRMTEGPRKTASNCSYPPADVQLGLYKWTALIPFCRVQRATAEVYPEIVADDLQYIARIPHRGIIQIAAVLPVNHTHLLRPATGHIQDTIFCERYKHRSVLLDNRLNGCRETAQATVLSVEKHHRVFLSALCYITRGQILTTIIN